MPPSFVVARDTRFEWAGKPFFVSGFNCYFLAYCCDQSRRAALAAAKAMGANTIRCWAFLEADDFTPGRPAFQYAANEGRIMINDGPDGLERLDALIRAAEDFDLKLILPLVNHWGAFGGMPAYVRWLSPGSAVTEFYRAGEWRGAYRTWVDHVLTRRNTITGRLYADEPAIMAWELTNEARCPMPGGRELMLDWIAEMGAFVKQRDSNHLLALGDEGFFYKKGLGHLYDGTYGMDWEANLALENMDFGTLHFYPQEWGYATNLGFGQAWITDHVEAADRLNKPALLEEYGLKTPQDRNRWYADWVATVRSTGAAGSLLWMLGQRSPDTAGYVDDYVVYGPSGDGNDSPG